MGNKFMHNAEIYYFFAVENLVAFKILRTFASEIRNKGNNN